MNTRTTVFDSHTSISTKLLQQALNDGSEHDIPSKYIDTFCEMVVNSMWRSVSNAIASCELYGDAWGFEFNLGGYIDTYYENDDIRWHGFSDEQVDKLNKAYPNIVQSFRTIGLDIIEHYLRCMVPFDIELAGEYFGAPAGRRQRGTFRNMDYIAYECRDGMRTAEEIYNRFVERAREMMHYNNNENEE